MQNPCQRCGACCALYRVALQGSETSDSLDGTLPVELTVEFGKNKRVMKGTDGLKKRCIALEGTVGASVTCLVYDRRPSVCRSFFATWEIERGDNPLCDRARAIYGMVPFGSY
jgi:Fe-S-cluster containining protein